MGRNALSFTGLAAALVMLAAIPFANAAEDSATMLAMAYPGTPVPVQTCIDGTVSADGCRERGVRLAAGNECPAASGKYCSDETPYCCGTPGNYYCAKSVNDC